jgi:hypothetical protein
MNRNKLQTPTISRRRGNGATAEDVTLAVMLLKPGYEVSIVAFMMIANSQSVQSAEIDEKAMRVRISQRTTSNY